MTQERLLDLAYEALLIHWCREKERKEKGKKEGYKTPIADYWEAVYNKEMLEISEMRYRLRENQN